MLGGCNYIIYKAEPYINISQIILTLIDLKNYMGFENNLVWF